MPSDTVLEELIELIRRYPELYDKKHDEYQNIRRKEDIWREIAAALDLSSGEHYLSFDKVMTDDNRCSV